MTTLEEKSIAYLTSQYAKPGKVCWIGIRPEREADLKEQKSVNAIAKKYLEGDHYKSLGGKRQVTLIQKEHLEAVASIMGVESIDPGLTRRNLVIEGINLIALKKKQFRVGTAVLEYTGECHPCSRMEKNLGKGGYNAMRGHGGITAQVMSEGSISIGDSVGVIS